MPKPRPDLCPDCGHSVTSHTGSYCENCGYVLVESQPLSRVGRRELEHDREDLRELEQDH